jgi:hypothetical protein
MNHSSAAPTSSGTKRKVFPLSPPTNSADNLRGFYPQPSLRKQVLQGITTLPDSRMYSEIKMPPKGGKSRGKNKGGKRKSRRNRRTKTKKNKSKSIFSFFM